MGDKYQPHEMNAIQKATIDNIRYFAERLDECISNGVPDSREKSLAFTKLEECVMWANKAIALHRTN